MSAVAVAFPAPSSTPVTVTKPPPPDEEMETLYAAFASPMTAKSVAVASPKEMKPFESKLSTLVATGSVSSIVIVTDEETADTLPAASSASAVMS